MSHPTATAAKVEQILNQGRPRRRVMVSVIVVVALAIFSGLLLFSSDKEKPPQYVTSEVSRGDLTIQVTATGTLEPLNQERGLTIMMVTHEADIAAYAQRVVRFFDGHIQDEVRN